MRITIPTAEYIPVYDVGGSIFPESWFTLNEWLTQGKIKPQEPGISNGNSLFENGPTQFVPDRESLLDLFPGADAIVYENPFVWEADLALFDLEMPTSILAARIPTGGTAMFSNVYKFASTGTSIKTVGEWIDSLCEVWKNDVSGKVQIFTNPINNYFIEFHLVRAFALEFTTTNHPTLTNNTDYISTDVAAARRALDPTNWIKQQPS